MTATIFIHGEASNGIDDQTFNVEVPDCRDFFEDEAEKKDWVEDTRTALLRCYERITGEERRIKVWFDFETI